MVAGFFLKSGHRARPIPRQRPVLATKIAPSIARVCSSVGLVVARGGSFDRGTRAGLHEIAFASRVRLDVDLDRIPVRPQTAAICRHYGIDPLGLIGSGALLVAVAAPRVSPLLRAWARKGIAGRAIGSVQAGHGICATRQGHPVPFPWLVRDEIIDALGKGAAGSRGRPRPRGVRIDERPSPRTRAAHRASRT